jgi:tRNA 2-thiouridine synthesizing protein A
VLTEQEFTLEIDVRGKNCPTPFLRMLGAIRHIDPGQILKVVATDLGTKWSFPAWAKRTGNEILHVNQDAQNIVWFIRKTN